MRGIDPKEAAHGDMHALKFTENLLASAIGAPSSRLVMSLDAEAPQCRQGVGAEAPR